MYIWQQDWISRWALYSPEQIAVSEEDSKATYSYAQLNQSANQIARLMYHTYKINKGDRIGVIADFSINYVALMSAAQKTGFVLVPINYRLTQYEISDILIDASPKMILCQNKYLHLVTDKHQEILFSIDILKDIKEDKESKEEIDVMNLYLRLIEQLAEANKKIKEYQERLTNLRYCLR